MAILYKKEQCYSWVRDAQDNEESNREKEQKMIKQDAALFKRHMKQMEARMELMRKKEEQKLQDAFLEEAYLDRMAMNEDADDEAWDKTAPMEDDEIDELMLSRLPTIISPPRRSASHNRPRVAEPTLQDMRDACADFAHGDKADDTLPIKDYYDDDDDETMEQLLQGDKRYHHLHTDDWFKERVIKEVERRRIFKKNARKSKRRRKKKVTICGKSIWNHASENAMSRDGWLQFSVMAKDCDLKHAIQLCRNWSEFSDLNLLTLWQYFPASNWTS
ncbi:uncharacterized protein FFB14_03154 [Fusarium fujikuroi]|nr:uncharacterized protein FFB14_03154 [Fusarium fujikuroi]